MSPAVNKKEHEERYTKRGIFELVKLITRNIQY